MKTLFGKASILAVVVFSAALMTAAPALAGAAGQNPATCGTGNTWRYVDFTVRGSVVRAELRHAYGCGVVGWTRTTRLSGNDTLAIIQSAWNPGQPSQYGVAGTNYTYTVDATPGHQVCGGFQAYWIDIYGNWHYINWFFAGCYWG